jgi:methionyl-tRNA synthetase
MEQEKVKKEIGYRCEVCGRQFSSGRERKGEKLCVDCIELRRALKGFLKRGLTEAQILERARKVL